MHILRKAAAKLVILGHKNQKKVPQKPGGTDLWLLVLIHFNYTEKNSLFLGIFVLFSSKNI